jgi:hypothetical protein
MDFEEEHAKARACAREEEARRKRARPKPGPQFALVVVSRGVDRRTKSYGFSPYGERERERIKQNREAMER